MNDNNMEAVTDKDIKDKIFSILIENQDKNIYRGQILLQLPVAISDRELRLIFREMVFDGYPVGSDAHNGYYVVDTQDKFERCIADYKAKMISINQRLNQLRLNIKDKFNVTVQYELGL